MTPQTKVAAVSAAVLALTTPVVVHFEGEIRRGYKDPIGVVTACVGHTKSAELGRAYTHAECLALLERDLEEHNAGLLTCIKVGMPPEVHAALLSWAFNVGVGNACGSTLVRKLNAGDRTGACAELSRWILADGEPLPGLVRRAQVQRAMCEGRQFTLGVNG